MQQNKPGSRALAFAVVGVIVLAVLGYFGFRLLEEASQKPSERGDASVRDAYYQMPEVEFEGKTYRQKRNVTTILFMGIDKYSTDPAPELANFNRGGGQADYLRLIAIDDSTEKVQQIAIDRDTLTPITILGVLGNRAGMRTERISLSHGFGDGKEQSCELTVEAMSNLLYGTNIDYYVALDMDGIEQLNDWLGGVTVTLEDDFTAVDPAMEQGKTVTLQGKQAEYFVRARYSVGIGTNESRMARQQVYVDEAAKLFRQKMQADDSAAENLYDFLNEYFTTNMSRGTLTNIAYKASTYELAEVMQPTGEHAVDQQGFMQFTVNEDSLLGVMVKAFYEGA